MARRILRLLFRLDDLLELAVHAFVRFARTLTGAATIAACLLAGALLWSARPPDQHLKDGALVPAISGGPEAEVQLPDLDLLPIQPVRITVDAIVGRHCDHCALVSYHGRSYRARPGTLIPQDGPPSFVITRVGCESVEAYDWSARETVKAEFPKQNQPPTGLSEQTE